MWSVSDYVLKQNPASQCPSELFAQLVVIPVRFAAFSGSGNKGVDSLDGEGIIEVHRDLAADVEALFQFMLTRRFPLSCVLPIACFKWDDECSMLANNTSGFNYRKIAGKDRLSKHAFGRAIDINPWFNPCIQDGITQPAGANYVPSRLGTLTADSPVTQFLKSHGWIWGGDWTSLKDYQHFEKPEGW